MKNIVFNGAPERAFEFIDKNKDRDDLIFEEVILFNFCNLIVQLEYLKNRTSVLESDNLKTEIYTHTLEDRIRKLEERLK